jgi:hypothetical protein
LDRSLVEVEGVAFRPMPRLLVLMTGSRAAAMTLGPCVFVRPDLFDAVVAGQHAELVAHELIHVRQWRSVGVLGFLGGYVGDYLRLRLLGLGHDDAYRRIGYEWEAYAEAHHIVQAP